MRVQVVVKATACAFSIVMLVVDIMAVLSGNGNQSSGAGVDMIINTCTDYNALTGDRGGWVWWWSGPGLCDAPGCGGGSVLTPVAPFVEVALNSTLGDGSW